MSNVQTTAYRLTIPAWTPPRLNEVRVRPTVTLGPGQRRPVRDAGDGDRAGGCGGVRPSGLKCGNGLRRRPVATTWGWTEVWR